MSIEINGINKYFGRTKVLNDISLDIASGEMVALLGPSGSGKTTLLRIIAGLESQSGGKLGFHGTDVSHMHARDRRVGFVFQHYALFRHMTVFDNIAFGLTVLPRRERPNAAAIKQKVTQLLDMVQLGHLANRYPSQLSGGQKQRVALARALAVEPQILLLDEPFGALDAQVRKELRRWLRQLHEELKFTSVFVTHDQEEALTMSDRIVVMREGRIEQDGTPREIYEEPKNLFVASFIGEINIFDAVVLQRLDPQRVRANVEGRECDIYADLPVEPGQKLKVLLRPEDLRVEEVNDSAQHDGLIGYVRERNYKGMTLESVVELESGKTVMVSEFFNEDDPDVDHSLNQKMAVTWVESWEVVLADEEIA
ncbi:spermidine/putrescine ABC transporter ATP-binding protein PotA [Serratia marcescens]|uniref:spermidine/putrescine ABC transporter ATP-binding protein PotA n=1 Tax=Serratia marcescens TaxID=615 RepID=UPI000F7DA5DA|nr:spermidine/putrescine ABC transporter ATP-binding protein PotA [Serratia marcescens]RTG15482.1 spermidine/putrescine ABC transporter ATP-binding protein PotA [Serratia marcescens]RTG15714.1 spermidine/putrescine ABC transporter ATP-binding protein PotA [Serratia marcescens]RTG59279.1 spermidine/putrescine ABC transporter ATP-binding protein PotA [Serratia marcescens]